jgi:hypothetical protein
MFGRPAPIISGWNKPPSSARAAIYSAVRLLLQTRLMDRDRDAWLLAAKLLALHGEAALDAVSIQLATLQRLVELKRDAEDAALLKFWRHTAYAMLTLFAAKPAGPQSVN